MQKARLAIPLLAVAPLLTACGSSLTVAVVNEDGEPQADHEVQFIPFDRDSLFDALAARADSPEPQIAADLQAARDSVQVLEAAWVTAEEGWGAAREELQSLSERLQGLDQRGREYRELYDQFGAVERRERSLNRQRTQAFAAFTSLQNATQTRLDSIDAVIEAWADIAFASYPDEQAALLEALGRQIAYDTTGVTGHVTRTLPGGTWWVHSRLRVAGGELYWNEAVEAGSVDTLRLISENAERRR